MSKYKCLMLMEGKRKVKKAKESMLGLSLLEEKLLPSKPFTQKNILGCITPTPETGALIEVLHSLGGNIRWCSDNQFAADDDVVDYIKSKNISIFGKSNMKEKEYFKAMKHASQFREGEKDIHILDDGADITRFLLNKNPGYFEKVSVITEQTTCGINELKKLYDEKKLDVPSINVNDSFTKKYFDNYHGIQKSLPKSLEIALEENLTGKNVTVFGYGMVGSGAAKALSGMGNKVNIVEQDIKKLAKAKFDGYNPTSLEEAIRKSDACFTATGCINVITGETLRNAKDGIILSNIGHGTQEYDVSFLENNGEKVQVNPHLDRYVMENGKSIYSISKGALTNLLVAGGNPPEVMNFTFTLTILSHLDFLKSPSLYPSKLNNTRESSEEKTTSLTYPELNDLRYSLTEHQIDYMRGNNGLPE